MLSLVSAKLRCPPRSLCHKKKNFLFEFEKLRQYSGWKAVTSALAFALARLSTPLPEPFSQYERQLLFSMVCKLKTTQLADHREQKLSFVLSTRVGEWGSEPSRSKCKRRSYSFSTRILTKLFQPKVEVFFL